MHLNHLETVPSTLVPGKIAFHETQGPGAKGWGSLVYGISIAK